LQLFDQPEPLSRPKLRRTRLVEESEAHVVVGLLLLLNLLLLLLLSGGRGGGSTGGGGGGSSSRGDGSELGGSLSDHLVDVLAGELGHDLLDGGRVGGDPVRAGWISE